MALERNRGNVWFKRFVRSCKSISPLIKFRRIKYGFYRIYWKGAYIAECYDTLPPKGYDKLEDDIRFLNQSYYEEYEDRAKLTRQIKNFVEGYYDLIDTMKTRVYMLKNDREFRDNAIKAYRKFYVK